MGCLRQDVFFDDFGWQALDQGQLWRNIGSAPTVAEDQPQFWFGRQLRRLKTFSRSDWLGIDLLGRFARQLRGHGADEQWHDENDADTETGIHGILRKRTRHDGKGWPDLNGLKDDCQDGCFAGRSCYTVVMSTTIKQTVTINATPAQMYHAWLDSKEHAAFTGGAAKISPTVGGSFSVFDNYATGETMALVPNKKIVQSWRASDWPKTVLSTLTVTFTPVKGGTKITLTQIGVPVQFRDDIAQGWKDYYWQPLQNYFSAR